jgi:hypothetical protein
MYMFGRGAVVGATAAVLAALVTYRAWRRHVARTRLVVLNPRAPGSVYNDNVMQMLEEM